jgi:glycosyltransferase involved in cell wall biosynthesis
MSDPTTVASPIPSDSRSEHEVGREPAGALGANVLLIAPLPPPITGHSLASEVLLRDLAARGHVEVVNLSIGSSNDGTVSPRRLAEVVKVLRQVWRKRKSSDAIYLTIAESFAGNVKDLAIYLICAGRLHRLFIHLHGGSIKKLLFDRRPLVHRLNALAVRRMGGVIVSGPSHEPIFASMIDRDRLHIVPNFAPDQLFVPESSISANFADPRPLRVLYLSGMNEGKGYLDLLHAYLELGQAERAEIQLDFAGKFDSPDPRDVFLRRIAGLPGVRYHGLVDDDAKVRLFAAAHVFCLPTRMFEGQPISILEAYAAACVVLTTGQEGIRDVFRSGVNGVEVAPHAPKALAAALRQQLATDPAALAAMARENRRLAEERYRAARFTDDVARILRTGAAVRSA